MAKATPTERGTQETTMWYFAWMLGLPLAAAFAILNAMWYELMDDEAKKQASSAADDASSRGKG